MRGQEYDGASNMSSDAVGIQACIKQVAPPATYIYCSNHSLNLVISKSCSLPQVRSALDCTYTKLLSIFLNSPKRIGSLEFIILQNLVDET